MDAAVESVALTTMRSDPIVVHWRRGFQPRYTLGYFNHRLHGQASLTLANQSGSSDSGYATSSLMALVT